MCQAADIESKLFEVSSLERNKMGFCLFIRVNKSAGKIRPAEFQHFAGNGV